MAQARLLVAGSGMDGQALSRASRVKGLSFRANTAKLHINLEIIREIFPTSSRPFRSFLQFSKVVKGNNHPEPHEYL